MLAELTVIGNLGRDPEMRYLQSGQPVTNFSVAATRTYKNAQGEKVQDTTWFRMSAFGKTAEICNQFLRKGSKVYIKGRLNHDASGNPKVFNRQDGTTGASFEVTVEQVKFLSSRPSEEGESVDFVAPDSGDEIPF